MDASEGELRDAHLRGWCGTGSDDAESCALLYLLETAPSERHLVVMYDAESVVSQIHRWVREFKNPSAFHPRTQPNMKRVTTPKTPKGTPTKVGSPQKSIYR